MPTCFFILSRFTLRVDNVLFRQFDTRIFHSFSKSPPTIIRETSGWEAPYERVQRVRLYLIVSIHFLIAAIQQLPRREDLHPLTDPGFIAKALAEMPTRISQREGAKTGWRALGTRREIIQLAPSSASTPA
jgi:type 2A phosphatase activator TIP41